MELIRGLHNLDARHRGSVVTIGNFDGLHRGHRAVVGRLRELAAETGGQATVVTFDPTPREHFGTGVPGRVQTLRDRIVGLDALGVARVLCLRFDVRLARMDAARFLHDILERGLGATHLVAGADFRFGHRRQGDRAMLEHHGITVETAPEVVEGGARVSSSRIRGLLASGDLAGTAVLLGRPWAVSGRVRHGDGLGRQLGYPTANLRPGDLALAHGVYAVRITRAEGQRLDGVASWGTRPAVRGVGSLLEAHLFECDADLYGERLVVEPVARLREERMYDDLEKMTVQMGRDVEDARAALADRA